MNFKTFTFIDYANSGSISLDLDRILDIQVKYAKSTFGYAELIIRYATTDSKMLEFIDEKKAEKLRDEIIEAINDKGGINCHSY